MKKFLSTLLFIALSIFSFAQNAQIKGKLTDQSQKVLIGARLELLSFPDTNNKKYTLSNENGDYAFSSLKSGNYLLKVNYLGYQPAFRRVSINTSSDVQTINISLRQKADQLKEVTVTDKAIIGTQKGDTSVFNANAFKTNPDASAEDLVTKMPGVTMVDGKVQAQGEQVQRVLVDGKPFFGEDPSAVLKNLPAEVIDKIEVFDKKSDQSQFTGFDDGNAQKTLNIVTKPSFKNGTFGRAFAGVNLDEQYKVGLNINQFKDNRRFTILYQSNNVNEQNFATEDLLGVVGTNSSNRGQGGNRAGGGRGGMMMMGGGGMMGGFGGNDASNFLVNSSNGINTTHAFGLNFSDKWGKKIDISSSYFFNYTKNNSLSNTDRTFITGSDQQLKYLENNISSSENYNHRFNLKLDYKIDTSNSITFQPRVSFQSNKGIASIVGVNTQNAINISNSSNLQESQLTGSNISAPLLYRRSFEKRGRTFSINISPTYTNQVGDSYLKNEFNSISDSTFNDTLNLSTNLDKYTFSISNNLTYTEPLDSFNAIIIQANYNKNYNNSDRISNAYSNITDSYSTFDSSLSNTFKSVYTTQSVGLGYRFQKGKMMWSISVNAQEAILNNQQQFPQAYNLNRRFSSFLPSGFMMYRIDNKRNLRMFFRSWNNAPSVDQLQEVLNKTNLTQLSIGNDDLDQDTRTFGVIRYSSVNTTNNTSFFAVLRSTFTQDYIGNSSFVAKKDTVYNGVPLIAGARLSRPVNLNGYYNISTLISYGFPFKLIKSNINVNFNVGISRTPSIVNNIQNFATTPTSGLGVVLSSNISKNFDFTLSTQTNYSEQSNSAQPQLNSAYINQENKVKFNLMPWKKLVLSTEFTQMIYEGISDPLSQNILLWNAGIGYKFMKKDAAEIRLTAFDILNQNQSVVRNLTDTYTEDVYTNILRQYVMLNFSWKFSTF